MNIGDLVRIIGLPEGLPRGEGDDLNTKLVFERSLGRRFPIVDITPDGLLELEVGEVMGVAAYLHSIWIEPERVVLDSAAD